MNIKQIASQALQSSSTDTALLAGAMWESLEDSHAVFHAMADDEPIKLAIQRNEEIDRGKTTAI
ncbi:hypothetical protein [Thiorhodovibrio frisius]|uniref:Uncharacterized protein n=1 Tax=Thiorhodovibrio frisius TaxID=631362 RepID=H8YVS8_9GAMM|nr:hypothetical protein [Thiorhodovibrio frisius]EIC24018.1 hypothetical protein Thi970DRAFT_00159 [Thiorhodovibrio frisius]WPL23092.1 hypothetical protein Thiofri_03274 [Thiorhodovibrio frisius]